MNTITAQGTVTPTAITTGRGAYNLLTQAGRTHEEVTADLGALNAGEVELLLIGGGRALVKDPHPVRSDGCTLAYAYGPLTPQ